MEDKNQQGLSYVGLLLGVVLLALLSAFTYLWIDPVARYNAGEDTKRVHDVNIIAEALTQYMRNHQGTLPFTETVSSSTKKVLCSEEGTISCAGTTGSCIPILDTSFYDDYLSQLPVDPDKTSTIDTGYYLQYSSTSSQLMVGACEYNNQEIIVQPPILVNQNIYYNPISGRPPCSGTEYAGHCWYYANATNKTCNTVCSDNGLTCESGVTYSPVDCTLNLMFTGSCAIACFAANDPTYPNWAPSNYSAMAICAYRTDPVGCATANTDYYSICPCQ